MLTGRVSYRRSIFGKMILQVEVKENYCHDLGGSGYYDEGSYLKFRDATWKDILELSINDIEK